MQFSPIFAFILVQLKLYLKKTAKKESLKLSSLCLFENIVALKGTFYSLLCYSRFLYI